MTKPYKRKLENPHPLTAKLPKSQKDSNAVSYPHATAMQWATHMPQQCSGLPTHHSNAVSYAHNHSNAVSYAHNHSNAVSYTHNHSNAVSYPTRHRNAVHCLHGTARHKHVSLHSGRYLNTSREIQSSDLTNFSKFIRERLVFPANSPRTTSCTILRLSSLKWPTLK